MQHLMINDTDHLSVKQNRGVNSNTGGERETIWVAGEQIF